MNTEKTLNSLELELMEMDWVISWFEERGCNNEMLNEEKRKLLKEIQLKKAS